MSQPFKLIAIFVILITIQACKKAVIPVDLASTLKGTWVGKWGLDFDNPDGQDSFYIEDNNKIIVSMYTRSGQSFGKYQGIWRINGASFVVDSAIEVTFPKAKLKCISSIVDNKLEGIWLLKSNTQYYDGTFYVQKQ